MRRTIVIIGIVIVLIVTGYFVIRQQQATQAAQAIEVVRRAEIEVGTIQATVNATGAIEPEALISLNFGLAGTIQAVNVVRGQTVQVGDILATLNSEELALQVIQAENSLTIQMLTLQQRLNATPSEATLATAQADINAATANHQVAEANLAQAQAGVLQAQAQRSQLLAGATNAEIAAAEAEIAARTAEMETIQDSYDRIIEFGVGGTIEEQTRFQLFAAQEGLRAAQSRLAVLQAGPRAADIQAADAAIASAEASVLAAEGNIAAAQANIARAEAAYQRLLDPPTTEEIAILEAQVESARTSLALAQLRLEESQIIAPMSGRVASVLINTGEQASPGAPAITLVNEGAYHITVNVDEIDIDQITLGQDVALTLDALPDLPVRGAISEIAPTSTSAIGGVVTYLVTINITEVEEGVQLRPGMSANASIITQVIENVLVVPNWAVRLDRETGAAFVQVEDNTGAIAEITIETGLRNEQFSEVISGLSAGDTVVITNEREAFSLFGTGE
ncbi:MAG: efflux RND transporter periplasmic adaptor subunit [Chloroflexi bacterium]|nr:efflux RND transporter periplasmic adaptor subunit [Chloroflexota bacterium]MBP8057226.1 efflux RND transporter periplasmic adaptor subunit [Chloroflexota bacterium]